MNYLIFGGEGFIGSNLATFLHQEIGVDYDNIYSLDIVEKQANRKCKYIKCDIREEINLEISNLENTIIFNLAAIHTTPGHPDHEYFEANIKGAEHITTFAKKHQINTLVFTSSIAPYGASEDNKRETTLATPNTPYGISKLVAEHIQKTWQAEAPEQRKLMIVRPGVVFGKGEGGNFTRLYKAMAKGFFFYPGRRDTLKACVYVKDVVRILYDTATQEPAGVDTFNLTYAPAPSIETICEAIAAATGVKKPKILIPSSLLKTGAMGVFMLSGLTGKRFSGIHPDRVKKLMISTNINGEKLLMSKHKLKFTLSEAIADWFKECNKEGLY